MAASSKLDDALQQRLNDGTDSFTRADHARRAAEHVVDVRMRVQHISSPSPLLITGAGLPGPGDAGAGGTQAAAERGGQGQAVLRHVHAAQPCHEGCVRVCCMSAVSPADLGAALQGMVAAHLAAKTRVKRALAALEDLSTQACPRQCCTH